MVVSKAHVYEVSLNLQQNEALAAKLVMDLKRGTVLW